MLKKLLSMRSTLGSARALGIDISNTAIKVIALSRDNQNYWVDAFSIAQLPKGAVVEKEIKNVVVVAEAIKAALTSINLKFHPVIIALADTSVISKIIPLDKCIPEHEMETQILLEVADHIPYPLEDVRFDFKNITTAEKVHQKNDILLIAARAATVENYTQAIADAGIKAHIVDVESYAMLRANAALFQSLDYKQAAKPFAVINIDAEHLTLTVIANHFPALARSQTYSGDLAYIVHYVHRELQFLSSTSDYHDVERIIIAGEYKLVSKLVVMLEKEIGVPITVANPFTYMKFTSGINKDYLLQNASAFMLSYGLALGHFEREKGINLLPWREQKRNRRNYQFSVVIVGTAIITLLVLVFMHMGINARIHNQQGKNTHLDQQINALEQQTKEVRALKSQNKILLERTNLIRQLQTNRHKTASLYEGIARVLPPGVFITSIMREKNTIILMGRARSNAQVSQLLRNINTYSLFTHAKLREIKANQRDTHFNRTFVLEFLQKRKAQG